MATEQQLRQKVVDIIEGWLGCKESDGSHKKIIDIYNAHKPLARNYRVKYTDAWCAATVSAAFIQAGLTDIAPTECSCGRMIELYQKIGRWVESDSYTPKIGDAIMYDWDDTGKGDNTGWPEHVGLVVAINGTTMTVTEGNYSNAVKHRTIKVNAKNIRGYCTPDYASKATPEPAPAPKPTPKPDKPDQPKTDPAQSKSSQYNRTYTVNVNTSLNMRTGAGTSKPIIKTLKRNEKVRCYGYYTVNGSTIWLYVQDDDGIVGYCSKKYLK